MFLKRLEIQGFKSFANKTALDFLFPQNGHHSITGVVGPNGAGKSNITDALRWAMGETSLKNLRGKKSEDVIFSGSEQKGALGAAEVTMILENKDGNGAAQDLHLGDEFPLPDTSSISITRRLYRSGESEYLVNNNPARLIDIHLLLAKLQFAEHAYSIVSQGMIGRLLMVGPSERKDWFDEACGIKEFQIKEHQAELKLARTKENMAQGEALLTEVEPRLRILSRQVKKLEKRQEVEAELKSAQERYYATVFSQHEAERQLAGGKLTQVEAEYREVFGRLQAVQEELASLARGTSREEIFQTLQKKYAEVLHLQHELERELAIIGGQLHTEYRASGAQNVGWLKDKISTVQSEVARREAEGREAESTQARAVTAAARARAEAENLGRKITEQKVAVSRLQHDFLKSQSEQNYREYSGLTAVKGVLEARNQFPGKIFGLVAELGKVEKEYALALEVAAGAHLSSVVVENIKVAEAAINYLRARRLGVATFLPVDTIKPQYPFDDQLSLRNEPGVVGWALDLIRYDEPLKNIFARLFGATLVVENLAAARRLGVGKVRMVTLEGDLVERQGILRGGFRNRHRGLTFQNITPLSAEEHAQELQTEINATLQNITAAEEQLARAQAAVVNTEVAAQSAKKETERATKERANAASELARLTHEEELLTASPTAYSAELKRLKQQEIALNKKHAAAEIAARVAETMIEDFNRAEEQKKQRVFSLQETMQKEQQAVNSILENRNQLKIELARLDAKEEDLAREAEAELSTTLHGLVERGVAIAPAEQLPGLTDAIQKLKYQLSLIGGIDQEVVAEHATTKERHDFLTSQLKDLRAATEDLEEMIGELSALMKKKRAVAFKQIRKEFDRYFKILFEGGNASLEEVYGEPLSDDDETSPDPSFAKEGETRSLASAEERVGGEVSQRREKVLTGVDVLANPPGKKIKNLASLSGGERTLTSIALICAILRTNPSPFVVLDEVEAALDEANTLRFTKILQELSALSQFIIVTHNRVTMHAADALYGVVMQGDGVSKLLSVKIEDVAQYSE